MAWQGGVGVGGQADAMKDIDKVGWDRFHLGALGLQPCIADELNTVQNVDGFCHFADFDKLLEECTILMRKRQPEMMVVDSELVLVS